MAPPKVKSDTNVPPLKFYKVAPEAVLPKIATEQSACFDLAACFAGKNNYKGFNSNNGVIDRVFGSANQIKIMPGDRILVPTGFIMDIPEGYSVRLHSRSGLSIKSGVVLANQEGIIDSDYVEELYVLLVNTSDNPYVVNNGDRVAQGELVPVLSYEILETKKLPTKKTSRNGGMGSTGVGDGKTESEAEVAATDNSAAPTAI